MSNNLLGCPFCGGEARVDIGLSAFYDAEVSCTKCHASGGSFDAAENYIANEAEAIAAWNTRHTESPLGPVADELERRAETVESTISSYEPDQWRVEKEVRADTYREAAALVRQSSPATAREVEELRAEVERLREALERITDTDPDEGTDWFHEVARAALASKGEAA